MYKYLFAAIFLVACSSQKEMANSADILLSNDSALANAHLGICVYDVAADKYIYDYQSNKYFVPASNTKIFTCYAGLKFLGDSLPGLQYFEQGDSIYLVATGDPTFLHRDFKTQPVVDFLNRQQKPMSFISGNWQSSALGYGWSWDDFNSSYMAERSQLPVYGNLIRFVQTESANQIDGKYEPVVFTEPDISWKLNFNPDPTRAFAVRRQRGENIFRVNTGPEKYKELDIPFVTNGLQSALELIRDSIQKDLAIIENQSPPWNNKLKTVYSQPTDSMLKPMMHNSDNFFAEQTLMMVSQLKLGAINEGRLIDTLLKTDLKGLPQTPRWVDGSGLSRYNLFTPRDFVWVLNRMRTEFPFERLKHLFPTGGQGTLRGYYKTDSMHLFAKTGTLSGHVALSGFLTTRKNKLLIFSVLVNNHNGSATTIRRQIERFLQGIANKY